MADPPFAISAPALSSKSVQFRDTDTTVAAAAKGASVQRTSPAAGRSSNAADHIGAVLPGGGGEESSLPRGRLPLGRPSPSSRSLGRMLMLSRSSSGASADAPLAIAGGSGLGRRSRSQDARRISTPAAATAVAPDGPARRMVVSMSGVPASATPASEVAAGAVTVVSGAVPAAALVVEMGSIEGGTEEDASLPGLPHATAAAFGSNVGGGLRVTDGGEPPQEAAAAEAMETEPSASAPLLPPSVLHPSGVFWAARHSCEADDNSPAGRFSAGRSSPSIPIPAGTRVFGAGGAQSVGRRTVSPPSSMISDSPRGGRSPDIRGVPWSPSPSPAAGGPGARSYGPLRSGGFPPPPIPRLGGPPTSAPVSWSVPGVDGGGSRDGSGGDGGSTGGRRVTVDSPLPSPSLLLVSSTSPHSLPLAGLSPGSGRVQPVMGSSPPAAGGGRSPPPAGINSERETRRAMLPVGRKSGFVPGSSRPPKVIQLTTCPILLSAVLWQARQGFLTRCMCAFPQEGQDGHDNVNSARTVVAEVRRAGTVLVWGREGRRIWAEMDSAGSVRRPRPILDPELEPEPALRCAITFI